MRPEPCQLPEGTCHRGRGTNDDIEANVSEKTGLFALVMVRRGLDDTSRRICRKQWVQHNKLIAGIHDKGMRQMVETKLAGNDPAKLIRQRPKTSGWESKAPAASQIGLMR